MKIDIVSGFLGAGKTTLIKKLIKEAYAGEKVVLIENEFGEIGIDGGFLQEAGINITEMNSGCICCSLVGDFSKALKEVAAQYAPDRIIIEPSGVGKLSDVIKAVENAGLEEVKLNAFCTVVDAAKCKMYMKNFGEFFNDQVENASCIILSHVDKVSAEKLETAVSLLKGKNGTATVVTAPWDSLDGAALLSAMERADSLQNELARLEQEFFQLCEHDHHECEDPDCCCHHHDHHQHQHHHECEDPDCCCHHEHGHGTHEHHHHHEHGHGCHEHHEHAHEHGHGCCEGAHHHHDEECHDPDCCCHHEHHHEHHHGHHHGHHHADEVFTSWGMETARRYTKEEIAGILAELVHEEKYGVILRAKGIVDGEGTWIHFDYVPEEPDVREGGAGVTGRICVIGCSLNEEGLKALFNL